MKSYGESEGSQRILAQQLFDSIRANTLSTINNEFGHLAYIYEWYDSKNGKGYGAHPSTGSSSLAVYILAEQPFSSSSSSSDTATSSSSSSSS